MPTVTGRRTRPDDGVLIGWQGLLNAQLGWKRERERILGDLCHRAQRVEQEELRVMRAAGHVAIERRALDADKQAAAQEVASFRRQARRLVLLSFGMGCAFTGAAWLFWWLLR